MSPYEDAISAYLTHGEPHPTPVPRDPRNPAEDEMADDDNETYHEEQKK